MSEPVDPVVAAACAKAGLVWVVAGGNRPQAVWFAWHDDAVLLVVGGGEQRDPVPPGTSTVEVQVPSKDTRARLVTFAAAVDQIHPGDPAWAAAVFRLRAGRLNASDTATVEQRWAASSRVLRLRPVGAPSQRPGAYDDGSGAVALQRSPAATVTWHPFHVGGRTSRRRSR